MDKQEVSLMVVIGVLVVALVAVNVMAESVKTVVGATPAAEISAYHMPAIKVTNGATTTLAVYNPYSGAKTSVSISK